MSTADEIIKVCEEKFDANQDDCNRFVKAVASAFGITLTGNADAITDEIQGAGWTRLADGGAAAESAAAGNLVIGGLKGADLTSPEAHGHVVVVVKGELNRGKYPSAYWGRLGGGGKKNTTINWSWRSTDRDKVKYGTKAIP
jgi:hypothetical protein